MLLAKIVQFIVLPINILHVMIYFSKRMQSRRRVIFSSLLLALTGLPTLFTGVYMMSWVRVVFLLFYYLFCAYITHKFTVQGSFRESVFVLLFSTTYFAIFHTIFSIVFSLLMPEADRDTLIFWASLFTNAIILLTLPVYRRLPLDKISAAVQSLNQQSPVISLFLPIFSVSPCSRCFLWFLRWDLQAG